MAKRKKACKWGKLKSPIGRRRCKLKPKKGRRGARRSKRSGRKLRTRAAQEAHMWKMYRAGKI